MHPKILVPMRACVKGPITSEFDPSLREGGNRLCHPENLVANQGVGRHIILQRLECDLTAKKQHDAVPFTAIREL